MATGNFINHENGIFVLPIDESEETENLDYREVEFIIEDFWNSVKEDIDAIEDLEWEEDDGNLDIFYWNEDQEPCYIAEISLEPGYYEGEQAIVDTEEIDDEKNYSWDEEKGWMPIAKSEKHKEYQKAVIDIVRKNTTAYDACCFGNGETFYMEIN